LIGLGIVVLLMGALYSLFWPQTSKEQQAWNSYHAHRYDEAIALFSQAIRAKPNNADAYTGRSWAYLARREWQKALADSTEALRLAPDSCMAATARANALEGLDRVPEAIDALNKAIAADSRCASAYYHRARIGYSHAVKAVKPLDDLKEAVRLDPHFAPAYSLQGLIRFEEKAYDEAIALCNKALEEDPQEASAYFFRGYVLLAKGRIAEGKADIERSLSLDPRLEATFNLQKQGQQR
jgi:tetratricopeptide (TPR) repeat protein